MLTAASRKSSPAVEDPPAEKLDNAPAQEQADRYVLSKFDQPFSNRSRLFQCRIISITRKY
jgi:hypothetical protein